MPSVTVVSLYCVALAPVVVRSVYPPVAPFRWILKPVSLLELSVQAIMILFDWSVVILSPDGATGILEKVVAFFSLLYPEIVIALYARTR